MLTIGFIGAGNMAQALMRGWQQGGDEIQQVVYSPHSAAKVADEIAGVTAVQSVAEAVAKADMLVLAMPPAALADVATELQFALQFKPQVIVTSVLGGVSLQQLHAQLGEKALLVRALPNVNVAIQGGYTAIAFDQTFDPETRGAVAGLFLALGRVDELPEEQFGAVSALAGSGPAFVAGFVEALAQAGVQKGIAPEVATVLAEQTVLGTVQHLDKLEKKPLTLANEVMTPGGSTAAGWDVMEQRDFKQIIADVITATMAKNAAVE